MKKLHQYWVYILKCADDSYYTGVTNNLSRRLFEHENGMHPGCYTAKRRPLQLVFSDEYRYILDAIRAETAIKKWSRRKKEALIKQRFELLSALSRKDFSIRSASRSYSK